MRVSSQNVRLGVYAFTLVSQVRYLNTCKSSINRLDLTGFNWSLENYSEFINKCLMESGIRNLILKMFCVLIIVVKDCMGFFGSLLLTFILPYGLPLLRFRFLLEGLP